MKTTRIFSLLITSLFSLSVYAQGQKGNPFTHKGVSIGVLVLIAVIILLGIVAAYQYVAYKRSSKKLNKKDHNALERRNSEHKSNDMFGDA